jgi:hypothetical protein
MPKFLSADPTLLGRPDVPPCSDAVDEELVGGTPEELKVELIEIAGALAQALKFPWVPLVAEPQATAACCILNWFTPLHATRSCKSRAPGTTPASFPQTGLASWGCARL